MNCSSCGTPNEEAAGACNLCGKLLVMKPVPAPAKPEKTPPDLPAARVPSWPNRAILCFLFSPALALLLAPLLLHKEEDQDEIVTQDRTFQFFCLMITSAVSLVATVPLAARVAFAPLFATVLSALVLILGMFFDSRVGSGATWITLGGIGLAWYGRSAFTRPWDPAKLVGWTLHGYKRLLAPDRWAALRLIGGILLFLGGIGFMLAVGTALRSVIPVSRPVAKFLAIPAFLGGFLAASGLSLSESEGSKPSSAGPL